MCWHVRLCWQKRSSFLTLKSCYGRLVWVICKIRSAYWRGVLLKTDINVVFNSTKSLSIYTVHICKLTKIVLQSVQFLVDTFPSITNLSRVFDILVKVEFWCSWTGHKWMESNLNPLNLLWTLKESLNQQLFVGLFFSIHSVITRISNKSEQRQWKI